jgi:Rab-like protein 3
MFYSSVDGIILVHDLTNIKSQENLKHWLADVNEQNENFRVGTLFECETKSIFHENNTCNLMPLLLIGTKLDLAQSLRGSTPPPPCHKQYYSHLRSVTDEINLDCMQTRSFAPASSNSIKLAKFLDKVIEHKAQFVLLNAAATATAATTTAAASATQASTAYNSQAEKSFKNHLNLNYTLLNSKLK